MKIINFKLNISKILVFLMTIVALVLFGVSILYFTKSINPGDIIKMTSNNYTEILKECHDNIDNYIHKKINVVGYIFRAEDFNEKQFVIARDMIVNYPYDARIVGFLCEYDEIKDYSNNSWIEISGVIKKGDYYGEIPVIKVESIKKIQMPKDVYVFPPEGFKSEPVASE